MAAAVVQSQSFRLDNDADGVGTLTFASAPTEGNILVAAFTARRDNTSLALGPWTDASVKTGANNWTLINQEYTGATDTSSGHRGALFWRLAGASEGSTVTFTSGEPNTNIIADLYEFSHDFTTPSLSAAVGSTVETSSVPSSNSVDTGSSGVAESSPVLWVAHASIRNGFNTASVNWSDSVNEFGEWKNETAGLGESAWKEVAATTAQNWTLTAANNFTSTRWGMIAGFVEAPAASWDGSAVQVGANRYRVRMANGTKASVRLADGSRL